MPGAITPAVNTQTNTFRGTGLLYIDYGLVGQRAIGATKDGEIKITIDREFMHTDYSGMYGPTKGNHEITKEVTSMEFDLLELGYQNFEDCWAGNVVTDEGTYHKITGDLTVADADYHTNVVWAGQRKDGKYAIYYLKNALGDGKIESALKAHENLACNVKFTACYDNSTPTTPPWELRLED